MVAIRTYRADELPAIVQRGVATALAQVVGREAPAGSYENVSGQLQRMYQQALQVPYTTILVADWPPGTSGDGPAAYALLMPQPNAFTAESELIILDIFTDPALRGRRVGRELLKLASQYARAAGCRSLVAQVALHNQPSLKLFMGSGFQGERVVLGRRL
jgi:ribosomal protein S18 acetylase RimI-like enzyme